MPLNSPAHISQQVRCSRLNYELNFVVLQFYWTKCIFKHSLLLHHLILFVWELVHHLSVLIFRLLYLFQFPGKDFKLCFYLSFFLSQMCDRILFLLQLVKIHPQLLIIFHQFVSHNFWLDCQKFQLIYVWVRFRASQRTNLVILTDLVDTCLLLLVSRFFRPRWYILKIFLLFFIGWQDEILQGNIRSHRIVAASAEWAHLLYLCVRFYAALAEGMTAREENKWLVLRRKE